MALDTTVQMVRDLLIGADSDVFTDDYIQRQIDQGLVAIDIAIMIAESSASLYATKTDIKVGTAISLSNSQKSEAWMNIKKNLILRKETGAGLPNDGSQEAGGVASGIGGGTVVGSSVSEMEGRVQNPDRTENQFEIGQFDNPPTSPTGNKYLDRRTDCYDE